MALGAVESSRASPRLPVREAGALPLLLAHLADSRHRMYLSAGCRTLGGMHTGEAWRLGRRPGLDGLRGIAILLVVVNHIDMPYGQTAGQAGVGAFFVLSGFLITSVLLERRHQYARLRHFYARRALRLGPALLACMAATWSFATAVGIPVGVSPLAALSYTMDFIQARGFQSGLYAHTWSLGVEEQFYLLWPIGLFWVLRRRHPLAIMDSIAVALGAWSMWLAASGASVDRITYAPDARAVGLVAGCALALAFAEYRLPAMPRWLFWLALAGLSTIGFAPYLGLAYSAMLLLVVPMTLVIVWACADGQRCLVLEWKWLRVVGERSYGLYVWHLPLLGFAFVAAPEAAWWARALVTLTVTAGFVELSWRLVERPFLPQSGDSERTIPGAYRLVAVERIRVARSQS